MKIMIMHGEVPADAPEDEKDVLVEVESVKEALLFLGHDVNICVVNFDMFAKPPSEWSFCPDLVFNLVESICGKGRYIHLTPSLLQYWGLPFTGAKMEAMFMTSNKIVAKQILQSKHIMTANWITAGFSHEERISCNFPYIVKSIWEHASIGLNDKSIYHDERKLKDQLDLLERNDPGNWFAEKFIDGREFNISIIEKNGTPHVLPISEIEFVDFAPDKPRIVGYRAKWDENSIEYKNTRRTFKTDPVDQELFEKLTDISLKCWNLFQLNGYARVDFRVNSKSLPYVLEVNANPCLSPDSGFIAACAKAGMRYPNVIEAIVRSATQIPKVRGVQCFE